MSRNMLILLILLLLNLVVALIYLIVHLRRQDRKKGLINFITFLAFPIVGFLYMGLSELVNKILFRKHRKEVSYEDLSFDKTRMKLVQDPDVEKSLNVVPLEEALIMSGKKERRQSLMEVLKQDDYDAMIGSIKEAVDSEDMEISHYAATFVTDTIARYKARELELRKQTENNPNTENLSGYIAFTFEMLDSGLFSGLEQERYVNLLDQAGVRLYEEDKEMFPERIAAFLLHFYVDHEKADRLQYWLGVIKEQSSISLECFKTYAEYVFAKGEKEAFFEHLGSVRDSSVVLDNEALEWVRFFA